MRASAAVALFLSFVVTAAVAQPVEITGTAKLVSDVSAIEPGKPFRLGVLIDMLPGWHVYWKSAGETGLPTQVKFVLPEGFVASELRWPAPRKFEQPGEIVGYGYEGSVLLFAEVTPPKDLRPGAKVPISAEVRWLACDKVCVPGEASATLTLAAAEQSVADNVKLFEEWAARVPIEASSDESPATSEVKGELRADGEPAEFVVTLHWKAAPASAEWFPVDDQALYIENIKSQTDQKTTRITFKARLLKGQKLKSNIMQSVVAYDDEKGNRHGLVVPVRLMAEHTTGPSSKRVDPAGGAGPIMNSKKH